MCTNLRQKQYYVLNEPVSKEEYDAVRRGLESNNALTELRKSFEKFRLKFPQKYMRGFQNENVRGNYLTHAKNAWHCFDCRDVWDARYCFQSFMKLKDCLDTDQCGEGELLYECANLGYNAYNVRFSQMCLNQLNNLTYCELCFNGCSDLFGCIGLKKKKFCILNREYSEEDYRKLLSRVIAHLQLTGEWGENLPPMAATTDYNLSVAQQFRPLTKEQALKEGYSWRDAEPSDFQPPSCLLPDQISEADYSITKGILSCECCQRNYKVIGAEFEFYKQQRLPLTRLCFLCRHEARFRTRTPRKLFERVCACCDDTIVTAYGTDRPEIVYCESCFQNALE